MSNGEVNGQIDYDAVLLDLEAKRAQIDTAIVAINLIKGSGGGSAGFSPGSGVIPSNAFFGLGIGEAAKKLLEIVKGKQTAMQITKGLSLGGLPEMKYNTVYAALRRREVVNGDIVRYGDDWGLKEWFSNVSLPKSDKKTAAKKAKKKAKAKKVARAAKAAGGVTKKEPTSEPKKKAGETKSEGNGKAKPISMVDAVAQILSEADKALHAEELVQRLKPFGKNTNIKSIAASLPTDGQQRFENIGGNTWALAVWPESKRVKAAAATA